MSREFPDLLYEQYLLGELPENQSRELEQSPGFARRIEELKRSNAEILDRYPPEAFARRIGNRNETPAQTGTDERRVEPKRRFFAIALPSLAALTLALVIVFQNTPMVPGTSEADTVRLKGAQASISLYQQRGQDVVELEPGARVQAGDRIQVAYNAAGAKHGAVYSLDGNGVITIHYPFPPDASTELQQGGDQRLPRSFTLDAAPLFERFYFVTSDQPFNAADMAETLSNQTEQIISNPQMTPELSDAFLITEFTIWKGE